MSTLNQILCTGLGISVLIKLIGLVATTEFLKARQGVDEPSMRLMFIIKIVINLLFVYALCQ